MLSDVVRGEPALKEALSREVNLTVEGIAANLSGDARVSGRERALAAFALCIGTLSLARATAGTPLSDELLLAARRASVLLAETPEPRA